MSLLYGCKLQLLLLLLYLKHLLIVHHELLLVHHHLLLLLELLRHQLLLLDSYGWLHSELVAHAKGRLLLHLITIFECATLFRS